MRPGTENLPRTRNQNYLLNAQEMEHPGIIFNDLFDAYRIEDLRQRLRDIMESALVDRDCDAHSYFFFFTHLEKLIEAAHIVAEGNKKIPGNAAAEQYDADQQVDEKFYKPPRFEEIASLRPMEALHKTFMAYGVNDLIEELEKWKKCVMTGAIYMFDETVMREQVWTFFDQLMCLVESAHIYYREQRASEKKEMENFYASFTLTYAQRELWDCFEAVVNDPCANDCTDKGKTILTYRCLMSILIATYYLLEGPEPIDSVVLFEKEAV